MSEFDFKYLAWLNSPSLCPDKVILDCDALIQMPIEVFIKNQQRLESLARLPSITLALGFVDGQVQVIAKSQNRTPDEVADKLIKNIPTDSAFKAHREDLASKAANSTVPEVHLAYRSLVASIAILTYGNLENFIVDLLAAFVKLRPNYYKNATASLEKNKIRQKNINSQFSLLDNLFPEEQGKPPHELRKWLKFYKEALLPLEAIRNLYAHRSGIVDKRFQEKVKTSPALSKYNIGDELDLDFQIARAFAGVTQACGLYISKFIVFWLKHHPNDDTVYPPSAH